MDDWGLKNLIQTIRSFTAVDDNDMSEMLSYTSILHLKKNEFYCGKVSILSSH